MKLSADHNPLNAQQIEPAIKSRELTRSSSCKYVSSAIVPSP